jgi:hypothetical protein
MKENLFELHDQDLPRWGIIREALQSVVKGSDLPISKAINTLINLEIGRGIAVPKSQGKSKLKSRLSQAWDVTRFSFPNIDSILSDVAIHAYKQDNAENSYAQMLLGHNGKFTVTFIADSKSIDEADKSQIMAAVIDCDPEFEKWIVTACQNDKLYESNIEHDILEALGGDSGGCCPEDWPHTFPEPPRGMEYTLQPEEWSDIWDHCALVEWPKDYIVLKTGPGAVVLSRSLYEFIMFYITIQGKDIGRLPCKNSDLLAKRRDFKPPSIMKNFRFDATNVRAMESAVAATGGTLVGYIDELLKTYLGTVVAKRLINNPPALGDAQSSLNEFNVLNKPFGFTVVDEIHKVRHSELNVPALIAQHDKALKRLGLEAQDANKRAGALSEEAAIQRASRGEALEQMKSIESNYKKMVAKMRAAQEEAYALRAELNAANDQLQSVLMDVEREPIPDKDGGIHTAYPTREDVADAAHDDSEAISERMTRLEETNADMMKLLKKLGSRGRGRDPEKKSK